MCDTICIMRSPCRCVIVWYRVAQKSVSCCRLVRCCNLLVLVLTALISFGQCDDVRLGSDGRVSCFPVDAVLQVSLFVGYGSENEQIVLLYGNSQNFSTDKYILTAEFSAVIVRSLTISDEGEYRCLVTTTAGNAPPTDTILSVYGESFRSLCLRILATDIILKWYVRNNRPCLSFRTAIDTWY